MLQQILRDMYVDPEILDELSDDQKHVLFCKMREEQLRRWRCWEDELQAQECMIPYLKKPSVKNVRFFCDSESNDIVNVIIDPDPIHVMKIDGKNFCDDSPVTREEIDKDGQPNVQSKNEQEQKKLKDDGKQKTSEQLKEKNETERLRCEFEEEKRLIAERIKFQSFKERYKEKLQEEQRNKEKQNKEVLGRIPSKGRTTNKEEIRVYHAVVKEHPEIRNKSAEVTGPTHHEKDCRDTSLKTKEQENEAMKKDDTEKLMTEMEQKNTIEPVIRVNESKVEKVVPKRDVSKQTISITEDRMNTDQGGDDKSIRYGDKTEEKIAHQIEGINQSEEKYADQIEGKDKSGGKVVDQTEEEKRTDENITDQIAEKGVPKIANVETAIIISEPDDEEERKIEEEWKEREKKAKEADVQRKNSFMRGKREFEEMKKLIEVNSAQSTNAPNIEVGGNNSPSTGVEGRICTDSTIEPAMTSSVSLEPTVLHEPSIESVASKPRSSPIKRPPLPPIPDTARLMKPLLSVKSQPPFCSEGVKNTKKERKDISRPRPPPSLVETQRSWKPNGNTIKNQHLDRGPRPASKKDAISWYKEVEYQKCSGLDSLKKPLTWLHGVISRQEAERLLSDKKQGSFLVRVSERLWGYAISFKGEMRCKHFLVDTSQGGYQLFGSVQIIHESLNALVEYHNTNHISVVGKEQLLYACGQDKSPPDYQELYVNLS